MSMCTPYQKQPSRCERKQILTSMKTMRSARRLTSKRVSSASMNSSSLSSRSSRSSRKRRSARSRPSAAFDSPSKSTSMSSTGTDEGASIQNHELRYAFEMSHRLITHSPVIGSKKTVLNVKYMSSRNTNVTVTSNFHTQPWASAAKHTRSGTVTAEYRMSTRMSRSHFSFHEPPSGTMRPRRASCAASGTPYSL